MKFNIEKFNKLTNDSQYYYNWDNELLEMCEFLNAKPVYENQKHYFVYEVCKSVYFHIGFDNKGNIFAEVHSYRRSKDKNKAIMNEHQINEMNIFLLQTINIFNKFGYIVH